MVIEIFVRIVVVHIVSFVIDVSSVWNRFSQVYKVIHTFVSHIRSISVINEC